MVICPDCGKEVPNAKFCKNCGARLPDVEEINNIEVEYEYVNENPSNGSKIKFCQNCGESIKGEFKFCPNCGADLDNGGVKPETAVRGSNSGEKNVLLAIILSVIFPGLGQMYLRLDKKGAYFLIGYVISAILTLLFIGYLLGIIIWIWALVDSIQSANALNRGEKVEDKLF